MNDDRTIWKRANGYVESHCSCDLKFWRIISCLEGLCIVALVVVLATRITCSTRPDDDPDDDPDNCSKSLRVLNNSTTPTTTNIIVEENFTDPLDEQTTTTPTVTEFSDEPDPVTTTAISGENSKLLFLVTAAIKNKRTLRRSVGGTGGTRIPISSVLAESGTSIKVNKSKDNLKRIHDVAFVNENEFFYTLDDFQVYSSKYGQLDSESNNDADWNQNVKNFNYRASTNRLIISSGLHIYSVNFTRVNNNTSFMEAVANAEQLGQSSVDAEYTVAQCPTTGEIFRLDTYDETIERWVESNESWDSLNDSPFSNADYITCTQNYLWGMIDDIPNRLMVSKHRAKLNEPWSAKDLNSWYPISDSSETNIDDADKFSYGQPSACTDSDNLVFSDSNGGAEGFFFYTGVLNKEEFNSTSVDDAKSRRRVLNFVDQDAHRVPVSMVSCMQLLE